MPPPRLLHVIPRTGDRMKAEQITHRELATVSSLPVPVKMDEGRALQRSKRHAPKVRSGCVTCKRRRVKCDEHKPACQRCKTNRLHCEGYAPPKTWIFEPRQQPSTTVSSRQLHLASDVIRESGAGIKLYPSKDLHYHGTFAGHPGELMAFEFFAKVTAPVAGRWAAPELWQRLVLRAAWEEAAIKDCIVSLTITSLERGPSQVQISIPTTLRSRDYYYFRAASLLSKHESKPVELCLIASVTFWHFDLFNRRPLRAMIHLHATTSLWQSLRGSAPFSTALGTEIEKLLCSLAGIDSLHESGNASHMLPSPEGYSFRKTQAKTHGFISLNAARASLSRCIWAAVLAYDPSATAHTLRDLADVEHVVFQKEMDGLLDFSDLPLCTLSDCLNLFYSWQQRMWLTPDLIVPFTGRQSLLLHAQLIQSVIQKDVNNSTAGIHDLSESNESLFVRVLDAVADIVRTTQHHKHSNPPTTDNTKPTSLRPLVLFIMRRTNLEATLSRAAQLMEDVEVVEKDTDAVLLLWMGFILENTLAAGPPVPNPLVFQCVRDETDVVRKDANLYHEIPQYVQELGCLSVGTVVNFNYPSFRVRSLYPSAGTMPPQRRRRFLASGDDLEAKNAREEKSIEECSQLDLDDSPDIAASSEKRRKGLMTAWKYYADASCYRCASSSAYSINTPLTPTRLQLLWAPPGPRRPKRAG
ncbi:hypothetical protein PV08_09862 [Exophiala spinifera]|uniref:Zn(2)-C6 fungal-type domain-containing protein n=1 Tax=Exophiala spinifera TaxID=91928 RepID=A0A0D2BN84_9EURO|nr:uncharacterized protein PV08_09862 [Exophiala spinifera]KIW12584.1 hypothetical protein PV08_09862 [Exophiala spinifera]